MAQADLKLKGFSPMRSRLRRLQDLPETAGGAVAMAGGQMLKKAVQQGIKSQGLYDTGEYHDGIQVEEVG